jgi:hypothetical protein
MTKLVNMLIFLTLFVETLIGTVYCKQQGASFLPKSRYKLRKFGLSEMNQQNDMKKAYEVLLKLQMNMEDQKKAIEMENQLKKEEEKQLRKKLQETIEREQREKKIEEMLRKEAERRKIYEIHLLPYQKGSNVLRNFHTNRF